MEISSKGIDALCDSQFEIKLVPTKDLRVAEKRKPLPVNIQPVSSGTPEKDKASSDRADLFRCLNELRNALATKEHLAPYMIFSEETLTQLAVSHNCMFYRLKMLFKI